MSNFLTHIILRFNSHDKNNLKLTQILIQTATLRLTLNIEPKRCFLKDAQE